MQDISPDFFNQKDVLISRYSAGIIYHPARNVTGNLRLAKGITTYYQSSIEDITQWLNLLMSVNYPAKVDVVLIV